MRILVDIEDADAKSLDELAAEAGQSRAALIRRAIADFLADRRKAGADAFGLWESARWMDWLINAAFAAHGDAVARMTAATG